MVKVGSWGVPGCEHDFVSIKNPEEIIDILKKHGKGIPYGMGRSYGDLSLNPGSALWSTRYLDKFVKFDPERGYLTVESGVTIADIQESMQRHGFRLAVTPGTKFVTVGGAIASDVHGKNQHRAGSFGNHLVSVKILRTDGSIIEASAKKNKDWLEATVGGIGLTGIILEACIKLERRATPWMEMQIIPYDNIDQFFELSDRYSLESEYMAGWLDTTDRNGRGIFIIGNPKDDCFIKYKKRKSLTLPFGSPISLINRFSIRLFNKLYFALKKQRKGVSIVSYDKFYYPLDALANWNLLYGRKGFYQYQGLIPERSSKSGIKAILNKMQSANVESSLAVLKLFSDNRSIGMISFPEPGLTFALDFPNNGSKTMKLFDTFDNLMMETSGKLYLAKDFRMPRSLFEKSYPGIEKFLNYKDEGISSALSRRLLGE